MASITRMPSARWCCSQVPTSYVRHGALISSRYTTVNVVKTILTVLGIGPLGVNDALASSMTELFDRRQKTWTY